MIFRSVWDRPIEGIWNKSGETQSWFHPCCCNEGGGSMAALGEAVQGQSTALARMGLRSVNRTWG